MVDVAQTREQYLADFSRLEKSLPAGGEAALQRIRKDAIGCFASLGFPTAREEEWRWTNVSPIAKTRFQIAEGAQNGLTAASLRPFLIEGIEGPRLVFLNGRFSKTLSRFDGLPNGLTVRPLAEALEAGLPALRANLARLAAFEERPFVALNTAFLSDGAFIHVAKGVEAPAPIQVLYVSTGGAEATAAYPRNLIVAEEGSRCTVVESYASLEDGAYLTDAVTEVSVGPNAAVDHYRLQRESPRAYHVAAIQARLGRDARFGSHNFAFGGAIARNELGAVLDGEHGEATLNGVYVARGEQLIDNHTVIDHAKPNCASHELYKGILDGKGRGVFNGKILVRLNAQKTDAKQTNKALLLSDDAQINTQPMLKIYADDVKCTHGATVGQLDKDALFYLRARGIGLESARVMLTYAFANEIVDRFPCQALKAPFQALLSKALRLPGAPAPGGVI